MNTPSSDNVCDQCNAQADGVARTSSCEIVEVLKHKSRQFIFSGFPYSETHTVSGWKFLYRGNMTACVCSKCITEEFEKTARLRQLWMLGSIASGLAFVGFLIGVVKKLDDLPNVGTGVLILSIFILCGVAFVSGLCWIKFSHFGMVEVASKLIRAVLTKRFGLPVAVLTEGKKFPDQAACIFEVFPPANWRQISIGFPEREARTGWSLFSYERKFGSSCFEYDEFKGAEELKVANLAEVLDADKMSPETGQSGVITLNADFGRGEGSSPHH